MNILAIVIILTILAVALWLWFIKEPMWEELFIGKYYYNKDSICQKNKITTPVYLLNGARLAEGSLVYFTKNTGDFFNSKKDAFYPLKHKHKKYIVKINHLGKILEISPCLSEK